ncbi:hypothetical protein NM688_g6638 [Phlebia brevispora]|uniref:Uncharacterized protein n=1 Tax=Phlebia brevispora TaxID=194682 RepID=A0ACC1SDZ5_9APHY|nr:hypothetical protein NM688_g6638 [Phlebia brevispora]
MISQLAAVPSCVKAMSVALTLYDLKNLRMVPGGSLPVRIRDVSSEETASSRLPPNPPPAGQSSAGLWYALTTGALSPTPPSPPPMTTDGIALPRLRRGGVRAPESLLQDYGLAAQEAPTEAVSRPAQEQELRSDTIATPSDSHTSSSSNAEGAQLLTPRSISPFGGQ